MNFRTMANGKQIVVMDEAEFRELADDNGGICLACYEPAYGVEPDARRYDCESCGAAKVYGAEECLLMGRIDFE